MGKISFGSGVPKDLAEKAAGMLNDASGGGRFVRKESDLLRDVKKASENKKRRVEEKHSALMRQSEEIKKRNRAKQYPGLSEEEIEKLKQEEQEEKKRLEQEKASKPSYAPSDAIKPRVSPDSTLSPEEKGRQNEYEKWLRKYKEALGEIEYGKALDYADWAYGRDYAPEYISEGEKGAEDAKWHLANLFLTAAKNGDKNFIGSNKPFPGFEDYVITHFGHLKDGLFKPEGEEASPEFESPDSVKDNSEKEGGKKRKMKTVRKHSLGGDDEDGKKE